MSEVLKSLISPRPRPGATRDIDRFFKTGELKRFGVVPLEKEGLPVFVEEDHLQLPVADNHMVDIFIEHKEGSRRLLLWHALMVDYRIPGRRIDHGNGRRTILGDIKGNFEFTSALPPDQYLREFVTDLRGGEQVLSPQE